MEYELHIRNIKIAGGNRRIRCRALSVESKQGIGHQASEWDFDLEVQICEEKFKNWLDQIVKAIESKSTSRLEAFQNRANQG